MEKQFECLRCKEQMKYLKEYRFDSQDNWRDIIEVQRSNTQNVIKSRKG